MQTHKKPGIWVYPRACGGTETQMLKQDDVQGLSPRVRARYRAHLSRVNYICRLASISRRWLPGMATGTGRRPRRGSSRYSPRPSLGRGTGAAPGTERRPQALVPLPVRVGAQRGAGAGAGGGAGRPEALGRRQKGRPSLYLRWPPLTVPVCGLFLLPAIISRVCR